MRTTADLHHARPARPGGRGSASTAPRARTDDGHRTTLRRRTAGDASGPATHGLTGAGVSAELRWTAPVLERQRSAEAPVSATRRGVPDGGAAPTGVLGASVVPTWVQRGGVVPTVRPDGPAAPTGVPAGGVAPTVRPESGVAPTAQARAVARVVQGRVVAGSDVGMATAEYAIATVAAVGFAGLLMVVLRSGEVQALLLGLIRGALSV